MHQAKKALTKLNANLMICDWIPSIRIHIQEKGEEREVFRVRRGRSTGCGTVNPLAVLDTRGAKEEPVFNQRGTKKKAKNYI